MTMPPELSPDEPMRLQALRDLNLIETSLEERFERLTRLAKRLLRVDIVAISLIEANRQFFKSIQGLDVCETPRDVSFCGHAILNDGLFVVPDAREDERFAHNPLVTGPPNIVSYASIPISTHDGYKVGTLCAINTTRREFTEENFQELENVAALAQLELQSAVASAVQASLIEAVEQERRRAMIDPLTRLWNREGILRMLDETVTQTHETKTPFALIVIDLDGFKQINDTYGHMTGDDVLRQTAKRILARLRGCDVAGRIGGDEFLCIVSPCQSGQAAIEIADHLRESLGKQVVLTRSGDVSIRASFGVQHVAAPWDGGLEDLIESADAALYTSKRQGRNRVTAAPTVHLAA